VAYSLSPPLANGKPQFPPHGDPLHPRASFELMVSSFILLPPHKHDLSFFFHVPGVTNSVYEFHYPPSPYTIFSDTVYFPSFTLLATRFFFFCSRPIPPTRKFHCFSHVSSSALFSHACFVSTSISYSRPRFHSWCVPLFPPSNADGLGNSSLNFT